MFMTLAPLSTAQPIPAMMAPSVALPVAGSNTLSLIMLPAGATPLSRGSSPVPKAIPATMVPCAPFGKGFGLQSTPAISLWHATILP